MVTFTGQVISGGVLSSTMIVCTQILLLPQSSVALQVLNMVYSWEHCPVPAVTSLNVIVGVASQRSVAVAVPVLAGSVLAVHSMMRPVGQVMIGGILSSIVIVCVHVLLLPQSSVALQVLVILNSCGHVGNATVTSLKDIVGVISHRSVAVAVPVVAGSVLAVHAIVTFIGHVMIGGVLSSMVIVCVHVLLLPQSSVALQVLVMVRSCIHTGDAVVTSLNEIVGVASQLSVAVAVPGDVLFGKVSAVHSNVTFTGHVITGGVLSSTVIN
jgi:hypothetical protein